MCTLIILNGLPGPWPVILAANRDEFYDRPSAPPHFISTAPPIFAGQDLRAGGTWMGVTPSGFFAGLTNQRMAGPAPTGRRSRGEVVTQTLAAGSRAAARRYLESVDPAAYNPFNLVFGDAAGLEVVYARDTMQFVTVPLGLHVLPNGVLDDPAFPKVDRAQALLAELSTDGETVLTQMAAVLGDTTPPTALPDEPEFPFPASVRAALHSLCVRTPRYGTCSASIVALRPGGVARYLFAEGAPDEAAFVDLSAALEAGETSR